MYFIFSIFKGLPTFLNTFGWWFLRGNTFSGSYGITTVGHLLFANCTFHWRAAAAAAAVTGAAVQCVWRVYDVVYFIALASCKSSLVPCVQLVLWHDHIVRTKRWLLISAPLVTPTTTPPFLPAGAPVCQKSWWGQVYVVGKTCPPPWFE